MFVTSLVAAVVAFFLGQALLSSHGVGIGAPHAVRAIVGAALYLTVIARAGDGHRVRRPQHRRRDRLGVRAAAGHSRPGQRAAVVLAAAHPALPAEQRRRPRCSLCTRTLAAWDHGPGSW